MVRTTGYCLQSEGKKNSSYFSFFTKKRICEVNNSIFMFNFAVNKTNNYG